MTWAERVGMKEHDETMSTGVRNDLNCHGSDIDLSILDNKDSQLKTQDETSNHFLKSKAKRVRSLVDARLPTI